MTEEKKAVRGHAQNSEITILPKWSFVIRKM